MRPPAPTAVPPCGGVGSLSVICSSSAIGGRGEVATCVPEPRTAAAGRGSPSGTLSGVPATILDGKATAAAIRDRADRARDRARRGRSPPGLGTLLVGDDPGSRWYVNAKHPDCAQVGIASIQRELPATATQADVLAVVEELNADPACTGYIVQLPLPRQASTSRRPRGHGPGQGRRRAAPGEPRAGSCSTCAGPLPCTPVGIVELLRRYDVPIAGAEVVVIGRGITVGRPLGLLLTRRSENATVTLCHTGTRDLAAHVRNADIVVAAAGVPGLVTADMVKPGAAVLDVGVSRVDGKIAGDVAPDVVRGGRLRRAEPGGVGPMTRAMLLPTSSLAAEQAAAAEALTA